MNVLGESLEKKIYDCCDTDGGCAKESTVHYATADKSRKCADSVSNMGPTASGVLEPGKAVGADTAPLMEGVLNTDGYPQSKSLVNQGFFFFVLYFVLHNSEK